MTGNLIELPRKFIVDASIAVKWFAAESDSPHAREIFERIHKGEVQAVVPDLIVYEVVNALWKSKKEDSPRILRAVDELLGSSLEIIDLDYGLVEVSVEYMVKYDLTFYDAVYVGLARFFKTPLITANPKDHNKVKEIEILTL